MRQKYSIHIAKHDKRRQGLEINMKKATSLDAPLVLYAELTSAQIRMAQRRIKEGRLTPVVKGVATSLPKEMWPALIAQNRIRVLAALFPGAIYGYRSAFEGGVPVDGILYLSGGYVRKLELPGMTVSQLKGAPRQTSDMPMQGLDLYFPSEPRLLLENLVENRGTAKKAAGRAAVEERLLSIGDSRGDSALVRIREEARTLAPTLALDKEFKVLDSLVGSILGTRESTMQTAVGRARTAEVPYDPERIALFEKLAAVLRKTPLTEKPVVTKTPLAQMHFAFLESYFSNFIEGTEFEVDEARAFVLEGKSIEVRPKDSHDIIGVYRQALNPAWANQTLAAGVPILAQLQARHADQMKERPEVGPGEFKVKANRVGNVSFVLPKLVRGTLVQGSQILPSVQPGLARALMAMFLVAEVHPFTDGNGRLARLVMNAELSTVGACRVIIPTLFREEYLDCLGELSRDGNPTSFIKAMQNIQAWSAAFDYENLDQVIKTMRSCNAFERSRTNFKLRMPQE